MWVDEGGLVRNCFCGSVWGEGKMEDGSEGEDKCAETTPTQQRRTDRDLKVSNRYSRSLHDK